MTDKLFLESFNVRLQEQDDGRYELRYFDEAGQPQYVYFLDTQHDQALNNYDRRVEEAQERAKELATKPMGGLAWFHREMERARAMQHDINKIMAAGRHQKPPAEKEQS